LNPNGTKDRGGTLTAKAGPVLEIAATGAPRGARAVRTDRDPNWLCAFRRATPSGAHFVGHFLILRRAEGPSRRIGDPIQQAPGAIRVAARRTHAFDHPLTRLAAKRRATLSHEGRGVGIRCTVTAPSPLVGEGFPPRSCARSCASRMAGRVRGETARGMNPTLACWAHPYGLEAARQQPIRRPLSP
jgi:hypothetical protein